MEIGIFKNTPGRRWYRCIGTPNNGENELEYLQNNIHSLQQGDMYTSSKGVNWIKIGSGFVEAPTEDPVGTVSIAYIYLQHPGVLTTGDIMNVSDGWWHVYNADTDKWLYVAPAADTESLTTTAVPFKAGVDAGTAYLVYNTTAITSEELIEPDFRAWMVNHKSMVDFVKIPLATSDENAFLVVITGKTYGYPWLEDVWNRVV